MRRNWAQFVACVFFLSVLAASAPALADEKAPPAAKGEKPKYIAGREAIRKALETPVTIQVVKVPFTDLIALVERQTHVRIMLDGKGFEDAGVAQNIPVSLDVTDMPAREALTHLLRQLDLAILVRDHHLLITTPAVEDSAIETITYDVTDLVMHRDSSGKWYESNLDDLVNGLMATIKPSSWEEVGGPGSMKACDLPLSTVLICGQTQEVHAQIAAVLVDLRKVEAARRGLANLPQPSPDDMLHRRVYVRNSSPAISESTRIRDLVFPPNENRDRLVHRTNQFAWDLFQRLKGRSDENLFFSPAGVALSLGVLRAGARDATAEELSAALHLMESGGTKGDLPAQEITPAFAAWLESMRAERATHGYELRVATKLWRRSGQSCVPAFLGSARLLGVEVELGSGMGREEFMRRVNDWTADQTRGTVEAKSSGEQAGQGNGGLLKNVMQFRGEWQNRFATVATRPAPFRAGKRTWSVPMMTNLGTLNYREVDGAQIVEIPYRGDAVSMIVMLPRDEAAGLEAFEKELTATNVDRWLKLLRSIEVDLYLPRFQIAQQHALKGPLTQLGLATTFDRNRANFKGIDAETPLYLESCDQQAVVEVSEEGTVATAVTGGRMGAMGTPPEPPKRVVFRADHPFLFLLRDVRTGAILFIGRYAVPTETAKAGA